MIISLLVSISALEPPETIYSIQIGAYDTQEEAALKKTALESKGYTPVRIDGIGSISKLRFGEFPSYMEAYLYRVELRKDGKQEDQGKMKAKTPENQ